MEIKKVTEKGKHYLIVNPNDPNPLKLDLSIPKEMDAATVIIGAIVGAPQKINSIK